MIPNYLIMNGSCICVKQIWMKAKPSLIVIRKANARIARRRFRRMSKKVKVARTVAMYLQGSEYAR